MSANFPIFYGINIGAGSWIENAHFELLAKDPVPVQAGRIWYNTTDKGFKYSSLNDVGAVIVRTFGSAEALAADLAALQSSLSAEVTRATDAEAALNTLITSLTTALNNEVARAGAAEAQLASDLAAAGTAIRGYVDTKIAALGDVFEYVSAIAGGADSASAVDLSLQTQKDAGDYYKVSAAGWFKLGAGAPFFANKGDGLLFNLVGEIEVVDNSNTQVVGTDSFITVTGSTDTGYTVDLAQAAKNRISTLESGLAAEVTRATDAETALDGRIDALESTVGGATGNLASLTTDAKTTLVAAINEVDAHADATQAALVSEVTRAKAAEATLTSVLASVASDLTAEVTRAKAAEGTLANLTTSVKTDLVSAINEVDANADAAAAAAAAVATDVSSVVQQINAGKVTFKSASPALTHTFAHGLNNEFVAFTVLVQRDDGLYRNDVVSVEEVDSNTLKVYLAGTARNVKVIAESAAAVSIA